MENRYTVSIVHGEHATLYHVVDAGAPEGEQPDIVLSLHNKPHAQAMAEELNKQAARIRELEGALRSIASESEGASNFLRRECPSFVAIDTAQRLESCSRIARRILAEGGVKP